MVDLKKTSDGTELRALALATQKYGGELETVSEKLREINSDMHKINYKVDGDIDRLNYKVDTLNADVRELRREIYELDRTIYKLRESVLDAIRNNRSGFTDWIWTLAPAFIGITFMFLVMIIKLLKS